MMRGIAIIALSYSWALSSVSWADECDGDPGYVLDVPAEGATGTTIFICFQAPSPAFGVLFTSLGDGPTDTPFGCLCVDFPPAVVTPFFIPEGAEESCFPCFLPCDPAIVGVKGYMQFIAINPMNPSRFGRSNPACVTITSSTCADTYCGFTQGGWGQTCSGGNVGCRRDDHFSDVFPQGLILGDADGPDNDNTYSLHLTSSAAVADFLPAGGRPGALSADLTNPTDSPAGVLAGQLAAAKINVGFDDAGFFGDDRGDSVGALGDLIFIDCVDDSLLGLSVREVIALADALISGMDVGESASTLNDALTVLNENFDGCGGDAGCLGPGDGN